MNKQIKTIFIVFALILISFVLFFLKKTPVEQEPAPTTGQPQVILEDGSVADPNEVVVTQVDPKKESEYNQLVSDGTKEYLKENYTGALTYYLKAEQVQPERFVAYYNAGNAYRNLDQISKAQEQFESALRYGPEEYAVYAALEEVYVVLQRDFDAARAMYQKAIQMYPESSRFHQAADNLELRIKQIESQ